MTPNGTAIRAIRLSKKIGLRALARLTGLDRGYLSRLERGLTGASAETIQRIARALAVSPADITKGDSDVPTIGTDTDEEIPHPASPEGQIYLYTPEQAVPHLRMSALTIKRLMYRRRIAFTPSGGNGRGRKHYLSGKQICEHIERSAVRPLAETKPYKKRPAA